MLGVLLSNRFIHILIAKIVPQEAEFASSAMYVLLRRSRPCIKLTPLSTVYQRNNPKVVPSPILTIGSGLDTHDTSLPPRSPLRLMKLDASDNLSLHFPRTLQ